MLKLIKKIIVSVISIILIFALCLFLINIYVINTGKEKIYDANSVPEASSVLVFGASVYGNSVSDILARRLDTAVEVYNLKKAEKIIVSGDHSSADYNEVKAMKEYLVKKGIPETAVLMDHSGLETYDSVYRAKNIFNEKSVIMISQEVHIIRALYIAEKLNLDSYGVPCGNYSDNELEFQKKREFLARLKAFVQSETPYLYGILWEKDNIISRFIKNLYSNLENLYENNN